MGLPYMYMRSSFNPKTVQSSLIKPQSNYIDDPAYVRYPCICAEGGYIYLTNQTEK